MAARKLPLRLLLWLVYAAMGVLLAWNVFDFGGTEPPRRVAYSEFLAAVDQGRVVEVRLTERELTATLAKPGPAGEKHIATNRLPAIDESPLLDKLEKQHVKFSGTLPASSTWIYFVTSLLPFAIIVTCKATLAAALARATSVLTRRRSDLTRTAKRLVECETLSREELDLLLQQQKAAS